MQSKRCHMYLLLLFKILQSTHCHMPLSMSLNILGPKLFHMPLCMLFKILQSKRCHMPLPMLFKIWPGNVVICPCLCSTFSHEVNLHHFLISWYKQNPELKSRSPWLNRKIFLFVESLEEYHKVRYREILALFFLETNLSKKTRKITQLAPLRSLNNGLYIGLIFNSSLFVSRENSKILFLFGKFLTYPINKYNNSCFSDLHRDYCPQPSHRPSKLGWYFFYFYGWYLDLQQYFLVKKHLLLY